ncbi:MAG: hypothetical protein E7497_03305 [Ruminococcus sp.]|nr:hypothetical protein [Ruminococcus sp.]
MLERNKIRQLEDFFLEPDKRPVPCVYFCRICGYSSEVDDFILKYYSSARAEGVVIEGKIPNPDEKNLSYYNEIMGTAFQMSVGFIGEGLKKWLPRMTISQRQTLAVAIYDALDDLRRSGKNENMLKNAYIKLMCWLYYKFERVVNKLSESCAPKILYEGEPSRYELILLSVLSCAGCDIVMLQYRGDEAYLSLDPDSRLSERYENGNMTAFPQDYSIAGIRNRMQQKDNTERLYGAPPKLANCTNAWISGRFPDDILKPAAERGSDERFFYNCFMRINGVEDKVNYQSSLIHFHSELKKAERGIVIAEKGIQPPSPEEISAISRGNYQSREQMLADLSAKIGFNGDSSLIPVIRKAFIDILLEEAEAEDVPLVRLTNTAVYLICWLRRYQSKLFGNRKMPMAACFIMFGGVQNKKEIPFLKFLSRLPVDVVILNPDRGIKCLVEDNLLYEINYTESLAIAEFPDENTPVRIGTAAYHAERELDTLMYQDSGMYRNMQHGMASTVMLSTMYEEISILWNQELKYRPNFSTENDSVVMPVIFAKVSGVKDGLVPQYWSSIKSLITPETFVIRNLPLINSEALRPVTECAAGFLKNGKLQRDRIRSHKSYTYGFLRESIQNHILDKLQMLIDRKLIKGTFENGTEYTIIAVALTMSIDIVRMIQNFDFTKKNPKVIYINTGEKIISLEDSILMAFLSLIGFDVLFFVPTGYKTVENFYNSDIPDEHQAGNYVYDLRVPDFRTVSSNTRQSWREKIFKRGT